MMPGMDGVEAFQIIKKKKLCENIPVIMFTANVMIGEREKFLDAGFKDFLAKPIIPKQLDEMLIKYLPRELMEVVKVEETEPTEDNKVNLPQLDEFDFEYAIGLLKSEELLMQSLRTFKDMLKYLPEKLKALLAGIENEEGLKCYRIEVHALKGTSATVGAILLSKVARLLEVAAKEGEIEKIRMLHPVLIEEIEKHRARVEVLFGEEKKEIESNAFIKSYFDMLGIGLMQDDYDTVDFLMEEINKYQYSKELQVFVNELSGQILNMDSTNAMETLEKINKLL
jgi:CheY-like chemotaxis protein